MDADVKPDALQLNSLIQNQYGRCRYCGRAGIQDAFYSKLKQFCSLSCCRAFSLHTKRRPVATKTVKDRQKSRSSLQRKTSTNAELINFNWCEYLTTTNSSAASVSNFRHCALSDIWDSVDVGVKVEVRHTDTSLQGVDVYWIATIINVAGYRVLLRYEGCGDDASLDLWTNVLSGDVHRVGWCAATRHLLVTPHAIRWRRSDWLEFIIKQLTGSQTLPPTVDGSETIKTGPGVNNSVTIRAGSTTRTDPTGAVPIEAGSGSNSVTIGAGPAAQSSTTCVGLSSLIPCLPVGARVEVVDKTCISAMTVAMVTNVVGGRLHLTYLQNNEEFWCHTQSSLLHPLGWSFRVGHVLRASPELIYDSSKNVTVTGDMFKQVEQSPVLEDLCFLPGMKLEAVDPLNLSTICVATVTKVLGDGYIMVGIDGSVAANGWDWFCYHKSSPCIFPAGFCKINNLELTPPRGFTGVFDWCCYLRDTNSTAAPVALFDQEIAQHGFQVGMKLEAADLMDPKLICVATVVNVIGRLLRIHFDGWESTFDQYLDCRSPDIYPVGWCELVGHRIEAPPTFNSHASDSAVYSGSRQQLSNLLAAKRKKSLSSGNNGNTGGNTGGIIGRKTDKSLKMSPLTGCSTDEGSMYGTPIGTKPVPLFYLETSPNVTD